MDLRRESTKPKEKLSTAILRDGASTLCRRADAFFAGSFAANVSGECLSAPYLIHAEALRQGEADSDAAGNGNCDPGNPMLTPNRSAAVSDSFGFRKMFAPGRLTLGVFLPIEAFQRDEPTMRHQEHLVRRAEELGFAALWFRDVPLRDPSFGDIGQVFDPWVYLGWIAAQTRTIALAGFRRHETRTVAARLPPSKTANSPNTDPGCVAVAICTPSFTNSTAPSMRNDSSPLLLPCSRITSSTAKRRSSGGEEDRESRTSACRENTPAGDGVNGKAGARRRADSLTKYRRHFPVLALAIGRPKKILRG
jgi:hypothetical protein